MFSSRGSRVQEDLIEGKSEEVLLLLRTSSNLSINFADTSPSGTAKMPLRLGKISPSEALSRDENSLPN